VTPLILALPGGERLAVRLSRQLRGAPGSLAIHRFPDGETRVGISGVAAGRTVILVGSLDRPDSKILPLVFAAATAREMGATSVGLVAPYLAYLRQDAAFRPGEGVSARHFARILSDAVSWLVTVDPHLHRIHDLGELYSIRTETVHAAPLLARWIRDQVRRPLIMGPDAESAQWVEQVASRVGAPWVTLAKRRRGDHTVELSLPPMPGLEGLQPVLVDDIVSSGGTMLAAARLLRAAGFAQPQIVAVHAVAAEGAAENFERTGGLELVSCNTIDHPTNRIDVTGAVLTAVAHQLRLDARGALDPAGAR
jgi:ribose-phosphate pyrophosphokinase